MCPCDIFHPGRTWVRAQTLCLLLLCVLLLAGIIGTGLHCKFFTFICSFMKDLTDSNHRLFVHLLRSSLNTGSERPHCVYLMSHAGRIKLQTHSESWAEERKQTLWGLSEWAIYWVNIIYITLQSFWDFGYYYHNIAWVLSFPELK